jgi:DHA1 family bicyclomycin/chloramphenicol resistance-like MFS transporter
VALAAIWQFLPDTLPPERRSLIGLGPVLLRYGVIFRERAFLTHALTGSFTAGALFAYLAATPQIFIGLYGWSAMEFAGLFGLNSITYIAYSQLNPALVNRYGIAPVMTAEGSVLLLACLVLAAIAWIPLGAAPTVAALLACELGFGLVQPCAMVGALSRHQAHAGSASALFGTMQYAGGAVAGLAVGALADGTARPMAAAMLLCAIAAMLAGSRRPVLIFAPVET